VNTAAPLELCTRSPIISRPLLSTEDVADIKREGILCRPRQSSSDHDNDNQEEYIERRVKEHKSRCDIHQRFGACPGFQFSPKLM
jgi:hypothetical protein